MKPENNKLRIYGIRPVIELLDSEREIQKIYIQKNIQHEKIKEIETKSKNKKIEIKYIPVQKLNRLTKKKSSGSFCFLLTNFIH